MHDIVGHGDPIFDKLLRKIGISNHDKIRVFLTICLILRLLLAGIVMQYYDNLYTPYVVGVFSFIAIIILSGKLDGKQWWNRYYHITLAVLLFLVSLYQILTGSRNQCLGILLYFDVFIGVMTFLYKMK